MENLTLSHNRSIYPDLNTDCQFISDHQEHQVSCQDSRLQTYSISSSDDERYFFTADLEDIKSAYQLKDYQQVIFLGKQAIERFRQSARSDLIKKNVANLTLDLSKIRSLMANAYLNLYRMNPREVYLLRAKNCLDFEYESIQTPYKRAQRLNNLGLCELLRGRCNNAYQHFSNAFRTYLEERQLRLAGLVKNIAEVYKQLEMYAEAVKYYTFVLEEMDRKGSTELSQYACIVISALECINQSPTALVHPLTIYQRAKQIIPKLDKEKMQDGFFKGKLRLQIIKFGIQLGISAKCITEQQIESVFHEVFQMDYHEPRLKFLKGQCCYAYRQLFRNSNWQKFRELSRLAEICFSSAIRE